MEAPFPKEGKPAGYSPRTQAEMIADSACRLDRIVGVTDCRMFTSPPNTWLRQTKPTQSRAKLISRSSWLMRKSRYDREAQTTTQRGTLHPAHSQHFRTFFALYHKFGNVMNFDGHIEVIFVIIFPDTTSSGLSHHVSIDVFTHIPVAQPPS